MDGLHERQGRCWRICSAMAMEIRLEGSGVRSCGTGRTASGRRNALKVPYDDVEVASVRAAARLAA
jgi:hypothetical protein